MGESYYPPQKQIKIIKVESEHDEDMGHEAVHFLGDNFGYGPLIILIIVAGLIVFRKKIKKFLGVE